MRKNALIIYIIICCCTAIYASPEDLSNVTFVTSDNNLYIETVENTILYKLDKSSKNIYNDIDHTRHRIHRARTVLHLEYYKSKNQRKSIRANILGYANSKPQFYYDTYLILYNDELYYVSKQFVKSNIYLDDANSQLDRDLSAISNKVDSLDLLIANEDAIINSYRRMSEEKASHFKNKTTSLPKIIDSIERSALAQQQEYNDSNFKRKYGTWYNSLPNSTKMALKAINVNKAELSSPNSAGGCSYSFYYTNKSHKTIKYLFWSGWVYNAVNDMVSCEVRGGSYVSGKDTGPVEPNNEYYNGGGSWENVIYNYSADRVKLSSIRITYMDGSSFSIKEDDIRRMFAEPKKVSINYTQQREIKELASQPYRNQLKLCKDSLSYWQKRVSIIHQTNNLSEASYSKTQLDNMTECKVLYEKRQLLQGKRTAANIDLNNFKRNNFLNDIFNSAAEAQSNKIRTEYEYQAKLIKKVSFGIGADWLISGNYMGVSLPAEVLFGNIDQRVNFSIAGAYTSLANYGDLSINQLSSIVTLHYNIGGSKYIRFPLSVGFCYNVNIGEQIYEVTGQYYNYKESYDRVDFSSPLAINKSNLSSIVSIGIRMQHWLCSMYARFDLTPLYNKSNISIPSENSIDYDDIFIRDIIDGSDGISLFGLSFKYYF